MEEKKEHIAPSNDSRLSDEELWFSALAADTSHRYDADAAYARFARRVADERQKRTKRLRILRWRYAAAVVVLLAVSVTSYWQGNRQVENRFADIVVEALLGVKTRTALPDGTFVWLNAGSRMAYSQGFGVTDRRMNFEGEGYFEVAKNRELTFVIHTEKLDVKVVGTKFNLRNYPDEAEAVVNLLEGKVRLENLPGQKAYCLLPGHKMVLNKETRKVRIVPAEVEKSIGWTRNLLLFDEMMLSDIARELERTYDVQIKITSPDLKSTRFYGNFNYREQTVYDVLDRLAATGKLCYERCGETICLNRPTEN